MTYSSASATVGNIQVAPKAQHKPIVGSGLLIAAASSKAYAQIIALLSYRGERKRDRPLEGEFLNTLNTQLYHERQLLYYQIITKLTEPLLSDANGRRIA
jgi:hypothetical protein